MKRSQVIIVAGLILGGCDSEPQQAQQVCHDEHWKEVPCEAPGGRGHAAHIVNNPAAGTSGAGGSEPERIQRITISASYSTATVV